MVRAYDGGPAPDRRTRRTIPARRRPPAATRPACRRSPTSARRAPNCSNDSRSGRRPKAPTPPRSPRSAPSSKASSSASNRSPARARTTRSASLRQDFNDQVEDFVQDVKIDAIIEDRDNPEPTPPERDGFDWVPGTPERSKASTSPGHWERERADRPPVAEEPPPDVWVDGHYDEHGNYVKGHYEPAPPDARHAAAPVQRARTGTGAVPGGPRCAITAVTTTVPCTARAVPRDRDRDDYEGENVRDHRAGAEPEVVVGVPAARGRVRRRAARDRAGGRRAADGTARRSHLTRRTRRRPAVGSRHDDGRRPARCGRVHECNRIGARAEPGARSAGGRTDRGDARTGAGPRVGSGCGRHHGDRGSGCPAIPVSTWRRSRSTPRPTSPNPTRPRPKPRSRPISTTTPTRRCSPEAET